MTTDTELKLLYICLDKEKKETMIRALDSYLDSLEKVQASRMAIRDVIQLKQEIETMKIC